MVEIKEISTDEQIAESVEVIREAFGTVASEFNLTRENAPTHPFFSTREQLLELHKKAAFYGLYLDGAQTGFVVIEKAEGGTYYLGRLAVKPQFRHRGYGRKLTEFVIDYVKNRGGVKVALGMIDSQTILKNWYKSLGFIQTGAKQFEHLPFVVCFMQKAVSAEHVN
ncbi:MAG: GNAT family N-acetyltransferase [Dehalococcoidia bacterium]|nr:GNAT family N-acetyltransferase [Dehalococcoidia bacterium]